MVCRSFQCLALPSTVATFDRASITMPTTPAAMSPESRGNSKKKYSLRPDKTPQNWHDQRTARIRSHQEREKSNGEYCGGARYAKCWQARVSVAINGAVLSEFDAVAHEGVVASSGQTPTVVTLETVTVVARRV